MRTSTILIAALAAVSVASTSASAADLRAAVDAVLASPNLQNAGMSVRIIDVADGRVLYSYHADEVLSAASNAKIVTTSAALDALGPGFELTTTLVARGEMREGTLHGDLILIGKGDPSMSSHWNGGNALAPLARFAKETAACGITAVSGDIIVDDSYFDREFLCPSWPKDHQWIYWYQAPVAALALNDNCVDVTVGPGSTVGAPAELSFFHDVGFVRLVNQIKTSSSKKGYGFYRRQDGNDVTAKGSVYVKAGTANDTFTVSDPPLYVATALRSCLAAAGVRVAGTIRRISSADGPMTAGATVLAVNRITLADVIKHTNLHSQNLYAEMILKTLGREVAGSGSWSGGKQAISKFLEKAGVSPGTYVAADGSGLARETKYSAKALTEVLRYMYTSRGIEALRDSLPLAGYNGTMSERLTEERYRGKVRAKTGYVLGASALSGYARTANGKTVAFSIIMNNFKGSNRYVAKPAQDDICRAIVDSTP